MLMLEVYYKKGQGPMDLARVLYGPFDDLTQLDEFFDKGVEKGVFNNHHKMVRHANAPSYEPNFKES